MGYISAAVDKDIVKVWERQNGIRVTKLYPAIAEFLIKDPRGMQVSIRGEPLRKLTFKNLREMKIARERYQQDGVSLFESDVNPAIKVLSKYYKGVEGGKINVCFLDIEVDYDPQIGFSSVDNPYAPINSIALYNQWNDRSIVLAVPPPGFDINTFDPELRKMAEIRFFDDEADLLVALLDEIEDADALCGWNSNLFDFPYIAKRVQSVLGDREFRRMSFDDARPPRFRQQLIFGRESELLEVGGRILADYMMLYKKFEQGERESYKLEAIAEAHLPELPKLTYNGSLADLYKNDFNHFVRYNIRDTEILKGFERVLGYMDLAVLMFREATGLFENVTGTVRLADYNIYNYAHHVKGVYVPDIVNNSDVQVSLKGAHVIDPTVGMHEWIGSVDVSSLYPSCIRSCNISPETIVGQFAGNWDDVVELQQRSEKRLSFKDEATGKFLVETAATWRQLFDENNCAVSGYGTVFRMDEKGVLPSILEHWFNSRVEVNKTIKQIEDEISSITDKYKPIEK